MSLEKTEDGPSDCCTLITHVDNIKILSLQIYVLHSETRAIAGTVCINKCCF